MAVAKYYRESWIGNGQFVQGGENRRRPSNYCDKTTARGNTYFCDEYPHANKGKYNSGSGHRENNNKFGSSGDSPVPEVCEGGDQYCHCGSITPPIPSGNAINAGG